VTDPLGLTRTSKGQADSHGSGSGGGLVREEALRPV